MTLFALIVFMAACLCLQRNKLGNITRFFASVAFVAVLAGAAGCSTGGEAKLPKLPEVVDNVIEKPKPLPGWVTIELPLPELADTRLESMLSERDQLRATVKLANCHRQAADKLSRGEKLDPSACGPGPLEAKP